jgi:hypothetical protein
MTPDQVLAYDASQQMSDWFGAPTPATQAEAKPSGFAAEMNDIRAQMQPINGAPPDLGYAAPYAENENKEEEGEEEEEAKDEIEKHGPSAAIHAGEWTDDEGNVHHGAKAEAKLFEFERKTKGAGDTMWDFEVESGAEAGLDVSENELEGEVGGGKRAFTPGVPKPKAEANLIKAKLGFASHNKKSDHDRGYHVGYKYGKSTDEEGDGLPVHFGRTDVDHDGESEYHFGMDVPTPWGTVSADYETETPGSDYVSSKLLGPLGMPLNIGLSMLGLGDYAPGTLLHEGVGWLGDKIFGSDDKASDLSMAHMHRSTERMIEQQVESGMSRESAELYASCADPWLESAREQDKSSEATYASLVKAGMSPEVAETTAGAANPGWQQLRQADGSAKKQYDTLVQAGMPPEAAVTVAQQVSETWQPPAAAAKPAPAAAPAPAPAPTSTSPPTPTPTGRGPMCYADDFPFANFAL